MFIPQMHSPAVLVSEGRFVQELVVKFPQLRAVLEFSEPLVKHGRGEGYG